MPTQGYSRQVEALASRLGKRFPLREEELAVRKVEFSKLGETLTVIEATDKNLGSRLFAESLSQEPLAAGIVHQVMITGEVIVAARAYFCEYWDDEPFRGKHPFIDALKRTHEVGGALYLSSKEE